MATEGERVPVQTYVSSTQRERWREEAEKLDMSQAEYVRTMVQAGRRGFELNGDGSSPPDESKNRLEGISEHATPGVEGLQDRVLAIVREDEYPDWEELLGGVTGNIEERLETVLNELQDDGRIQYNGRHDGYVVTSDEH